MADRTVMVELKAQTAAFQKSMHDAAGSMKGLDAEQAKAQKRAAMWTAVGKASTVAGAGLAAGLLMTTRAASNQEQAVGALSAVFKTNTQAMLDNAKGATEIGLSTTQYANSAAKLGAQLGNLGIDQSQLAGTTDDLISKAADMAAQFGGPTSEAVDAIGAALRGERDPIERYGVTLTETGIKAEMAATGLDKAQATVALLNKQLKSSGTIGAAAREYDTVAAATQRMQAQFENAQAALGTALLPAMTTAADAASKLLGAFNSLSPEVQQLTTYVLAATAALMMIGPRAVPAIRATAGAVAELRAALAATSASTMVGTGALSAGTAIAGIGTAATAAAGAILGATYALDRLSLKLSETTGVAKSTFDGIASAAVTAVSAVAGQGAFGSLSREILAQVGLVESAFGRIPESYRATAAEMQSYIDQLNSGVGNQQAFVDALNAGKSAAEAFLIAGGGAAQTTAVLGGAMKTAASATTALESAFGEAGNAAKMQSEAVRALSRDLRTLAGINLSVMEAEDALIGRTQRLTAARNENGRSLDRSTVAGRANRAVMREEAGLITDLADAVYDRTLRMTGSEAKATAAANAIMDSQVAGFRAAAVAAGFNEKAIDALIAKIFNLPGKKDVKVGAPGAKGAKDDVDALNKSVKGTPSTKNIKTTAPGADAAKTKMKQVADRVFGVPNKKDVKTDAPGAVGATKDLDNTRKAADDVPGKVRVDTDAPGAQGTTGDLQGVGNAANGIPGSKTVHVGVTGASDAIYQLNAVASAAADQVKDVYVRVTSSYHIASGGPVPGFASGGSRITGPVHGPGTTTSDSIPARLSRGEFVMSAAAVRKYGLGLMFALNARRLAGGGTPNWLVDPKTGKAYSWADLSKYGWADERWRDYNPLHGSVKKPKRPPKLWKGAKYAEAKPERKEGQSREEYKESDAFKAWKQRGKELRSEYRSTWRSRVKEFKTRKAELLRERKELIEREKLDDKWEKRDAEAEAAAKRRADIAAAIEAEHARRVEEAQARLDDVVARRESLQKSIYESMTGDWLGTFDFNAAAEATQRLADATTGLRDARRAVNEAAPADRAAAMEALAAAQKEAAAAKAAAAAAAPTPKNVLKAFSDRARQAKEYAAAMTSATNRGVSQDLLTELATAGPEAAAPMLEAIRGMTPAQIAQLNAQIKAMKATGMSLAGFLGEQFFGADEAAARAALAAAQQHPAGQVTVNIGGAQPIQLRLDSREIWKGQLRLQRRTGNTYTFVQA